MAAVVLLPRIGSFGFWEPQEIQLADQARASKLAPVSASVSLIRSLLPGEGLAQRYVRTIDSHNRQRADACEVGTKRKQTTPAFNSRATVFGLETISASEFGARLPFALLGVLTILAVFITARRLATPRAAVIASVALVSFPLFVFEARQLNSGMGAVCGSTLLMMGLLGLIVPRPGALVLRIAGAIGHVAAVAVGASLSYAAAGTLLGIVPCFAAAAIAGLSAYANRDCESPRHRGPLERMELRGAVIGAVSLAITAFLIYFVLDAVFHWTDAKVGDRAIAGKTLTAAKDYVPALGGIWKAHGSLNSTFSSLFEHIAYGSFPLGALAPLAFVSLCLRANASQRFAGVAMFAWAIIAWFVATILMRKVGAVHFPALAAMAIATGVWLDSLLTERERVDGDPTPRSGFALPLAGLFVFGAILVIAKDLQPFTEKLAGVHITGGTLKFPEGVSWLKRGILVIGLLIGGAIAAWCWLWQPKSVSRRSIVTAPARAGLYVALGLSLAFSVFLAQVWTPALSNKLSSRDVFERYHALKSSGDKLGIMGSNLSCLQREYYVRDTPEKLVNRTKLLEFLAQDARTFAFVPPSELCSVHRAARGDLSEYYVLDNSNQRFLLLSNRLGAGEQDRNPLLKAIQKQRPTNIRREVSANFDNKIELIGINMPASVARGSKFQMTLFFKVLKPISGAWKIFAHFDGGMRFQGDHEPIAGRCGTNFWREGDYISDTFTVEAGNWTYPKRNYTVHVGFFRGSAPNWKNMEVVSGNKDNANRVRVGGIQVR